MGIIFFLVRRMNIIEPESLELSDSHTSFSVCFNA